MPQMKSPNWHVEGYTPLDVAVIRATRKLDLPKIEHNLSKAEDWLQLMQRTGNAFELHAAKSLIETYCELLWEADAYFDYFFEFWRPGGDHWTRYHKPNEDKYGPQHDLAPTILERKIRDFLDTGFTIPTMQLIVAWVMQCYLPVDSEGEIHLNG